MYLLKERGQSNCGALLWRKGCKFEVGPKCTGGEGRGEAGRGSLWLGRCSGSSLLLL